MKDKELCISALQKIIDDYNKISEAMRWRNASKESPTEENDYLVNWGYTDSVIEVLTWDEDKWKKWDDERGGLMEMPAPLHWLPIPVPPKNE